MTSPRTPFTSERPSNNWFQCSAYITKPAHEVTERTRDRPRCRRHVNAHIEAKQATVLCSYGSAATVGPSAVPLATTVIYISIPTLRAN